MASSESMMLSMPKFIRERKAEEVHTVTADEQQNGIHETDAMAFDRLH
jgi:hypothetical protein